MDLSYLREANPDVHVHYHDCKDSTAAHALKDPAIDCVAVFLCPIPSDLELFIFPILSPRAHWDPSPLCRPPSG